VIELQFSGWFQCRLATDPDPFDEPRGVSGYVRAYAHEPDLDRIVRFQAPPFTRAWGPPVAVNVAKVLVNGREEPGHPLVGASVDLLDEAKFEGRNGAIADDGQEPIYPFVLEVRQDQFHAVRTVVPADPDFPYDQYRATYRPDSAAVQLATGVHDLAAIWAQRRQQLVAAHAVADEPERTGMAERMQFLDDHPDALPGMFAARMFYRYDLGSAPTIVDPGRLLADHSPGDTWWASFWLGGWDADALCGFALGSLVIGATEPPAPALAADAGERPQRRP
jgi:hypothetical protein